MAKKNIMWLCVVLTVCISYIMFYHSSIPLLYAYLIYPFVCSLGLMIAGFIGRSHIVGKIILKGVIGAFAIFILILIISSVLAGIGIIFWGAGIITPLFNGLLIFGILISGLVHSS